jgi:hypothetical protein
MLIKGKREFLAVITPIALFVSFFVAAPPAQAVTSSITANFNGTAIAAGNQLWFTAVINPSGVPASSVAELLMDNSTISFTANSILHTIQVPTALVTWDPTRNSATPKSTTSFVGAGWQTVLPTTSLAGNQLLDAVAFNVPAGGLPGGIQNVTWTANFVTDTAGLTFNWQWAAANYTPTLFSGDYNALQVKPVDDNSSSAYLNSDHAGTPQVGKTLVTGGATGGGGSNFTGSLTNTQSVTPTVGEVPEPSAGVLILACAVLSIRRRSGRKLTNVDA